MSPQNLDFALSFFEMDSNGEGGAACCLTLTNSMVKFIIIIIIIVLFFKYLSIQTDHSPAEQFDCAKRMFNNYLVV